MSSLLELRVASTRIGERAHVVAVSGELDLHSAPDLQTRLAEVIAEGASAVVIDLLGVSFVDSAGLGVLVGAAKALRSSGGRLVVAADDRRITRVLQLTGLDRAIEVETSLVEAVEHVINERLAG
jgi:anti-sigma B factor antagonist